MVAFPDTHECGDVLDAPVDDAAGGVARRPVRGTSVRLYMIRYE